MQESDRRHRLERLYAEHAAEVYAYARRRTDAPTAEDVVMDVFVVACRRLEEVPHHPLPWLLGCARRVLANRRRSARRAEALIDRIAHTNAQTTSSTDTGELVREGLAKLRDADREILMLSGWEELDPSEIATVLGCTRAAALVRLHRARRRLRAAMTGGPPEHAHSILEVAR